MNYAFTNALIIDGTGSSPARGTVVVCEGKVSAVNGLGDAPPPDDCRVVDLQGNALLPGFIDAHIHVGLFFGSERWMQDAPFPAARRAVLGAARIAESLRGGVTTLRDLGTVDGAAIAVKEALELGQIQGSRLLAAGDMIVMTGGHAYQEALQVDGPEAVRMAIRENLKSGADVIKLSESEALPYPEFTMEELRAAVQESHYRGVKVACHVESEPGLHMAVEAGVDTIEHGFNPSDETLELMAEKGTYWVPTITINRGMRHAEHTVESHLAAVSQAFADRGMRGPSVEAKLAYLEECFLAFPERFRKGLELGIPIVAGSDGPRPPRPGTDAGVPMDAVRNEIVKLAQWGMTPVEAIRSGTSRAAEALGLGEHLGRIEVGCVADLVAVRGNPADDIETLDNVVLVMKAGELVRNDLAAR